MGNGKRPTPEFPREAVRLERQHQTPPRKRATRRRDRRRHFHRVMTVIVNQRVRAGCFAFRHDRHFAVTLEAAAHAVEIRECSLDIGIFHFKFSRNRDRGQRVLHVVLARQIQHDVERRAQRSGDLFVVETAEKTHFDDFAFLFVKLFQLFQCFVEREQINIFFE